MIETIVYNSKHPSSKKFEFWVPGSHLQTISFCFQSLLSSEFSFVLLASSWKNPLMCKLEALVFSHFLIRIQFFVVGMFLEEILSSCISMLYIPSTLIDLILWHTHLIVCSTMLNHGLFLSLFKFFGWKYILNWIKKN